MAVRHTRIRPKKRGCLNCPPSREPEPVLEDERPSESVIRAATKRLPANEASRLWRHVIVGTSTCVSMIEQYAAHGMEGGPVESVRELRNRLTDVINTLESCVDTQPEEQ